MALSYALSIIKTQNDVLIKLITSTDARVYLIQLLYLYRCDNECIKRGSLPTEAAYVQRLDFCAMPLALVIHTPNCVPRPGCLIGQHLR